MVVGIIVVGDLSWVQLGSSVAVAGCTVVALISVIMAENHVI